MGIKKIPLRKKGYLGFSPLFKRPSSYLNVHSGLLFQNDFIYAVYNTIFGSNVAIRYIHSEVFRDLIRRCLSLEQMVDNPLSLTPCERYIL